MRVTGHKVMKLEGEIVRCLCSSGQEGHRKAGWVKEVKNYGYHRFEIIVD